MSLFNRKERQEAARVKEFGEILDEIAQPSFWDALIAKQTGGQDSLVRAVERRATTRNASVATLVGEYAQQIATSAYPTSECFDEDTLQRLTTEPPSQEQTAHLGTCHFCRELIEACRLGPEEHASILTAVRQAAADKSAESAGNWTKLLLKFREFVQDQGLEFAKAHPKEDPIVVVDDDNVVDPERWDQEPALADLSDLYREAERVLKTVRATPLCRVVVLKADVGAYDERDYAVIRRTIANSVARRTFFVPSRFTEVFGGRPCTVVGLDTLLEMSPVTYQAQLAAPGVTVTKDLGRARDIRRIAEEISQSAFWVYRSGELNPRLRWALDSKSNDRLQEVLAEVARQG